MWKLLNKRYIEWTQWRQKQLGHLVGVKPSEAALSEQDFMQSNGEEVEEPGSTQVWHEERNLSLYLVNLLQIKMKCGNQGGVEETSQWGWNKGCQCTTLTQELQSNWNVDCIYVKSISFTVWEQINKELDMTLDRIRMDRWRQEGSAEVRRGREEAVLFAQPLGASVESWVHLQIASLEFRSGLCVTASFFCMLKLSS